MPWRAWGVPPEGAGGPTASRPRCHPVLPARASGGRDCRAAARGSRFGPPAQPPAVRRRRSRRRTAMGPRCVGQPIDQRLVVDDRALPQPGAELRAELRSALKVIAHGKTADGEAFAQDTEEIAGPVVGTGLAEPVQGSAHGDASMRVHELDRRAQLFPTHVVEIDVDAFGCGLAQPVRDRAVVIVEGRVEPEFPGQIGGLVPRSGAADHPGRSLEPGDLAGHASGRPRRAGDEDGVAGP